MSIFKEHICRMNAYVPPLKGRGAAQHLLLDFNERTVPVSEAVKQALIDFIQTGGLQQYPDYGNVTERLATYCGASEQQLMLTNGSDQGIDLIVRSACREGDQAIIPAPSFAMYHQCAAVENLNVIEPPYTRSGGFPTHEVLQAITPKTRLVIISNPNNPSGTLVAREDILRIAAAARNAVILVDECYYEYSRATVSDQLKAYPNLLITRTFSKTWGLASLRVGYVLSAAENIKTLLNVRGPYDINQLAAVAVQAALAHPQYTQEYVKEVMQQAKPELEQYLASAGIVFWPSAANYVWMFPHAAEVVDAKLRKQGVLVRPRADVDGNLGLRVTVGTVEQTRRLINALKMSIP